MELYDKPILGSSLHEQLAFVNWELNNTHKSAGDSLRGATTAEQASSIVYRRYEIPGDDDTSSGQRIANARAILEVANNPGNPDGVGLVSPVPGATATSQFGPRNIENQVRGASRNHKGIDFGANLGTPILAAGSGTVTFAGRAGSAGNMVTIDHGGGLETKYMHMQDGSFAVSAGAQVWQGQTIGRVGSTGRSSGPHLHFEVLRNGRQEDPRSYLNVVRAPSPSPSLSFRSVFGPIPMARDPQEARRYFESLRGNRTSGVGVRNLVMMSSQPSSYSSSSSYFPSPTPRGGPRASNPDFSDFYFSYHGTRR
jgi:murein DD-endopeptidase MepM/ murein hydrolase activator NlpD